MAKNATKKKSASDRAAGKTSSGSLERRAAVRALLGDTDGLLFVTGLAGAKGDVLEAAGLDYPMIFPMGGAMGGAAAMGLGLALSRPDKRVVVVTGDGELLMNVGTLATIAVLNPANLSIVCVDNEHYGETGFQKSHTGLGVDLAKIAEGSGIQAVRTVRQETELAEAGTMLRQSNGTSFVLLKVRPTDPPMPPHSRDAAVNKTRFREALLGTA